MLRCLPGPEGLVEVVTCRMYTPVEGREKRRRGKRWRDQLGPRLPSRLRQGELWLVITWARQIFDIIYYITEHIVVYITGKSPSEKLAESSHWTCKEEDRELRGRSEISDVPRSGNLHSSTLFSLYFTQFTIPSSYHPIPLTVLSIHTSNKYTMPLTKSSGAPATNSDYCI